jgi:tetratricopeptide (TPR) repeat protein
LDPAAGASDEAVRARALHRAGRLQDALAAYDACLAREPGRADLHLDRGSLLAAQGAWPEAIASTRAALGLQPGSALAWSNLGNALAAVGDLAEALAALRRAAMLQPDSALVHFNLGNALAAAGQPINAIAALKRAVELDFGFAAAAVNLSTQLRGLGASEAAYATARLAVEADPALPHAHNALGNALHDLGRFAEASDCYRRTLALAPRHPAALTNLARSLEAAGELAAALQAAEQAVAAAPDLAEARLGRATALLASGDTARGWAAYRARWQLAATPMRPFAQPLWRGEALRDRTILLHAEQGLGDALQFVRFAPRVAAAGGRVILEVQPELVRLFAGLPGVQSVLPRGSALPAFDLHCPLMDLAEFFASDLKDLAPAEAYLRADPGLIDRWRLPQDGTALRVGLVWAGDARPELPHASVMDRRRSLPLAAFAPLAGIAATGRIRLFSLQVGAAAAQLRDAPPGLDIFPAVDGVADFADTAAIVAQLQLVIAVDTSTAHLAAALGRPVWLLSRFDACWRWMRGRADSPWYPTLRIYRQPRPNDWAPVLSDISADLARLAGAAA